MNRWEILGAIAFAALFAGFALWRVDAIDSTAIRGGIAAFLFAFYCAIVIFGTSDKKRRLSLPGQTLLGVLLAGTLAALFGASSSGYLVAVLAGLVLGYTADIWAKYVQLP